MNLSILVLSLCIVSDYGYGHRILFVHDMGTTSHLFQIFPMVEKLLENGNSVTGLFFKPSKIKNENYTEILIPNMQDKFRDQLSKMYMEKGGQSMFNWKVYQWFIENWTSMKKDMIQATFGSETVRNLLKDATFDAVVTMPMGNSMFAEIFDCPLIAFSPAGPIPFMLGGSGNIINLNVQPLQTARYIEPMSLSERLINHVYNYFVEKFFVFINEDIHQSRSELLGRELPSIEEVNRRRFAIFLSNSHPITHGAWQYAPNIIEVGGLNIRDAKPLPDNFKSWLDAGSNGVVLVSFGSVLQPSQMDPEKLKLLLDVFRSLKQYSFIWKWDTDIENVPENVQISSWLPQQDILSHPNLRVFVTHGGIGSVTEAIYHKASLIGIPFSNDQKPNLLRAQKHGFAKILDWDEITHVDLKTAIEEALEDKEMSVALDRVNRVYTDREMKPVDKAAWWIEYVCRNGITGASPLKPITDIPVYQYLHLDVILICVTFISITLGSLIQCCLFCYKRCCTRKQKTE